MELALGVECPRYDIGEGDCFGQKTPSQWQKESRLIRSQRSLPRYDRGEGDCIG
jgi:hypothetical protein